MIIPCLFQKLEATIFSADGTLLDIFGGDEPGSK
jgi:hypothetical protein